MARAGLASAALVIGALALIALPGAAQAGDQPRNPPAERMSSAKARPAVRRSGENAWAALAGMDDAADRAGHDAAGALAEMKAVVASVGFEQLDGRQRAVGFSLLAWTAVAQKDYALARDAADQGIRAGGGSADLWLLKAQAAQGVSDWDDMAQSIANLARGWPRALRQMPDGAILRLASESRGEPRFQALMALHEANWSPQSRSADASRLWLTLTTELLARGKLEQAKRVAHDIMGYRALIELHADRRFDPIVASDPDAFDVAKAIDRDLEQRRAAVASAPHSLAAVNALALALRQRGKPADALAVTDDALAGAAAPGRFTDLEDELNRTLEQRAFALQELGRTDEAIRTQRSAAASPEHRGPNISQTLDLADMLNELGRAQDALDALRGFDATTPSAYGKMVWEQDLACAYAQLHDTAGVAGAVQYLRAHRADAEIVFEGGLMCAGEADDVAKAVISGIENPDTRSAVLADDQTYLDPPGPQSAWM